MEQSQHGRGILVHSALYYLLACSHTIPEVTEGKRRAYVHFQFVEVSVHILLLSLWEGSMDGRLIARQYSMAG